MFNIETEALKNNKKRANQMIDLEEQSKNLSHHYITLNKMMTEYRLEPEAYISGINSLLSLTHEIRNIHDQHQK